MQNKELQFIIDTNGCENQKDIAVEECSELIKAIIKSRRYKTPTVIYNLFEEIADVEIMLEQLKIIYSCKNEVERIKQEKIKRTIQRLRGKFDEK